MTSPNFPSKLPTGALGQSEAQTETKHVSWRFLLGRTPAWWVCMKSGLQKGIVNSVARICLCILYVYAYVWERSLLIYTELYTYIYAFVIVDSHTYALIHSVLIDLHVFPGAYGHH